MSERKYGIFWRNRLTRAKGRGQPLFTKERAEEIAKEMNREHPDIEHKAYRSLEQERP